MYTDALNAVFVFSACRWCSNSGAVMLDKVLKQIKFNFKKAATQVQTWNNLQLNFLVTMKYVTDKNHN